MATTLVGGSSANLPENMPLHTKVLWGENGVIRKLKLAPNTRQEELRLRVKMLQLHQKIALGSLGAFFYQSYLGKQLLEGNYDYYNRHASMSKVVWSSYMLSASLSYLAPPGMLYSKKLSSMKIHRLLSWIHFAGMASIPWLGFNISKSNNIDDRNAAIELHQNVAYMTLFTMSFSALLSFLPY
ncbi:MAG: hypothetical protein CMG55_00415 [Candidatus Marinimicrobia bacterium]|nr:hypothetical protein [Candidatus Neomarinimicrobiota bacterium]